MRIIYRPTRAIRQRPTDHVRLRRRPQSRLPSHRDLAVVPGVLLLRDPGESHATSELAQSRHHRRDPRKSRDPITWPEGFCSSLSAGLGPASCASLGSTTSPPPSNLAGVLEWCPQTSCESPSSARHVSLAPRFRGQQPTRHSLLASMHRAPIPLGRHGHAKQCELARITACCSPFTRLCGNDGMVSLLITHERA